jgi:hypothetical protein
MSDLQTQMLNELVKLWFSRADYEDYMKLGRSYVEKGMSGKEMHELMNDTFYVENFLNYEKMDESTTQYCEANYIPFCESVWHTCINDRIEFTH